MTQNITVSPSPHISKPLSTRAVMLDVIIALVPAVACALIFFRVKAAMLIAVCVLVAMATEWLCNLARKKPNSLGDLSAALTGLILALSVSSALPLWTAAIGSAFSIAIGKMVFGGLGANIFNPAMVGRTFITASFGILMTTWTVPATLDAQSNMITAGNQVQSIPQDSPIHALTQATPLALSKEAIKSKQNAAIVNNNLWQTFIGQTGGCIGETSALAIIIGGIYLLIKKTIKFHIPLAVLISAFLIAAIAWIMNPGAYVSPLIHLTTGGLLFCAFFIATDPVTSPLTTRGEWLFGLGVGLLIMLIRIVGEYPEGIMYAILIMNGFTPLIDRFCKCIPAGGKPK